MCDTRANYSCMFYISVGGVRCWAQKLEVTLSMGTDGCAMPGSHAGCGAELPSLVLEIRPPWRPALRHYSEHGTRGAPSQADCPENHCGLGCGEHPR